MTADKDDQPYRDAPERRPIDDMPKFAAYLEELAEQTGKRRAYNAEGLQAESAQRPHAPIGDRRVEKSLRETLVKRRHPLLSSGVPSLASFVETRARQAQKEQRAVDMPKNEGTRGEKTLRDTLIKRRHPLLSAEVPSLSSYVETRAKFTPQSGEQHSAQEEVQVTPALNLDAYGSSTYPGMPQAAKRIAGALHSDEAEHHDEFAAEEKRQHNSHPIGDRRAVRVDKSLRTRMGSLFGGVTGFISRSAENSTSRFVDRGYYAALSLGNWGYLLVAKLALFWQGLIAFHPLENLGFAAFVMLPAPTRFWRIAQSVLAVGLALTLLYYDSWFPPIGRLIEAMGALTDFGWDYLSELILRFINVYVIAGLIITAFCYRMAWQRYRVGVLVVIAMLGVMLVQSPFWLEFMRTVENNGIEISKTPPSMDSVLQSFFDRERSRSVVFSKPSPEAMPFDVIFIHVCSLSWDDVQAVGLEEHPLWQRFDFIFKRFNSVTSYSGPAAIHLLRAPCGQQKHANMYGGAPENCYLMDSLHKSGFELNLVLNHDGKFDDFLGQVRKYGRFNAPQMSLDGVSVAQYAFDKSPVYDDAAVLNRWMERRQRSDSERVALYYNTVSMHDGNHLAGTRSEPNTLDTYKLRLVKFLDQTEDFIKKLEASHRRAVVVMVPEHGAALRGDKRQIAGLREIPTPSITLIPVGIKVIGASRAGGPAQIEQSSSFLAVAHIIERMLQKSPFDGESFSTAGYIRDLPVTPYVAQSEKNTVLEYEHLFYLNRGQESWDEYSEFNQSKLQ